MTFIKITAYTIHQSVQIVELWAFSEKYLQKILSIKQKNILAHRKSLQWFVQVLLHNLIR